MRGGYAGFYAGAKPEAEVDDYYARTLTRLRLCRAATSQSILSILSGLIEQYTMHKWHGYLIEALNLRAICYEALGDRDAALADLPAGG